MTTAKKLRWWIVGYFLIIGAACVGIAFLPTFPTAKAYIIGFLSAACLAAIAWLIFLTSGSYGWSVGKMGGVTAQAVASTSRRRRGWRLVNGLRYGDRGDIDHVLVGPGGVFVIESKYSTSQARVRNGAVLGITGGDPITQVLEGAHKVQLRLTECSDHFDVKVRPMVVIWGPGRVKIDQGWQMVNDVMLCDGPEDDWWLRELDGEVLDQELIDRIEGYLVGHLEAQPQ